MIVVTRELVLDCRRSRKSRFHDQAVEFLELIVDPKDHHFAVFFVRFAEIGVVLHELCGCLEKIDGSDVVELRANVHNVFIAPMMLFRLDGEAARGKSRLTKKLVMLTADCDASMMSLAVPRRRCM